MARRSDHTRDELQELLLEAARRIIRSDGVEALTARRIAKEVGYTPGTIYQHFKSMDDLVQRVNRETLEQLYVSCAGRPATASPREKLLWLAAAFMEFAREHRNEWDCVIGYRYAAGHEWTDEYNQTIERLLGLLVEATGPLFDPTERARQVEEVRLLWASLYGIFTLDVFGRLGDGRSPEELIGMLVDMFLASRGKSSSGESGSPPLGGPI